MNWVPVINERRQASIWPAHLTLPGGWRTTGPAGDRESALDAIDTRGPARCDTSRVETVDRRFAFWAERTPNRVAATESGTEVTYRELACRMTSICAGLRHAGVRQGDKVGVCMERGIDLLAVLLGILAAGAAYVPLDGSYPQVRLAFMTRDVGVRCVVASSGHAPALAEIQAPVVTVAELMRSGSREERPAESDPGGLAYIMYTSGSTGEPKGVAVTHHNVAHFLNAMAALLPATAFQRVLFSTPLSFDIAGLEIFFPLANGGTCVIAPHTWLLDARGLARLINRTEPTLVQATPVGWRLLLDAGTTVTAAQTLLCGGDNLAPALAARLAALPAAAYNMYGPTEATVWATAGLVTGSSVSIGTALAHARAYVLDDDLRPASEGEAYIGGPAVAHGYYGRPRLTAERFLPDAWSSAPGQRMYATGDAVRVHHGCLEWLHRRDTQVKLNGNRIELGEIETIAARVAGVRAAAAVIAGDALHLYAEGGGEHLASTIHTALRRDLPAAMVPQQVHVLPALPVTANGKLDRGALTQTALPGPLV